MGTKATVVTEANLRELKTFIDAIGWKLIWGLNLGDDKLDNAVEQARAVTNIMGDRLLALEIGNEPDLFPRSGIVAPTMAFPPGSPTIAATRRRSAAVLPHALFAGPDLAGATDWMEQFARDEPDAVLLTAHHYITGQANPAATIDTCWPTTPNMTRCWRGFRRQRRTPESPGGCARPPLLRWRQGRRQQHFRGSTLGAGLSVCAG